MRTSTLFVISGAMLAAMAGCGSGGKPVEYDPLKDRSSLFVLIANPPLSDRKDVRSSLYLSLSGEGKHPAKWSADLRLSVYGPKDMPDILGENPKLAINPSEYSVPVESYKRSDPSGLGSRDDSASFEMPINRIADLTSKYGKLELNGTPIALANGERAVIRDAIVAAREATNAGK